jgi:hypothetical protein
MRFIILTLVFSTLTSFLLGQSGDTIQQIRNTVEQINLDTSYTIKTLNNKALLEEAPNKTIQLIGYFKSGNLIKVLEKIEQNGCSKKYEYYYQGKLLIFVSGREHVFAFNDSTQTFDKTKEVPGWGCSYYLFKGSLIKTIKLGHSRCFSPDENPSQFSDILNNSKKYFELLNQ